MLDLKEINKIYISGIGGIGVSGLAQILLNQGIQISGSDLEKSHVTDLLELKGIAINYNQISENISDNIDIHIYSPAVPITNEERQAIEQKNIQSYSYPEFLGLLTQEFNTIAISGTNGKTTTTAMVGHIFEQNNKRPQVLVGSLVPKWGSNVHLGDSDIFIIESCEHQAHMTLVSAQNSVITNIEEDHLDFYKDIEEIKGAFNKFVFSTKEHVIMNGDDDHSIEILNILKNTLQEKIITFGIENPADFTAKNITIENGLQHFDIFCNDIYVTNCTISLPGKFSVYNVLAAIVVSFQYDISIENAAQSMSTFTGTWRRFEKLGTYNDSLIISDYAHHPTAISSLIHATKEFFPDKKVNILFQPHQHNRTKNLFSDFVTSFNGADVIILSEIFDVAGREEDHDQNISSRDIVTEISKNHENSYFAPDFETAENLLNEHITSDSITLIVGAGDIYKLAEKLVS